MLARTAKPKLSLTVPAINTSIATAPRSPRSPMVSAATPISQAARNTVLNQRGCSTLQVPTFTYTNSATSKSILKRGASTKSGSTNKSLRFDDEPSVLCISPLPAECHGGYVKISKDERRWKK